MFDPSFWALAAAFSCFFESGLQSFDQVCLVIVLLDVRDKTLDEIAITLSQNINDAAQCALK